MEKNNSKKSWYKTHVPKIMRKGLTRIEKSLLRERVYHDKVKYV